MLDASNRTGKVRVRSNIHRNGDTTADIDAKICALSHSLAQFLNSSSGNKDSSSCSGKGQRDASSISGAGAGYPKIPPLQPFPPVLR
jgi:hypothetical protein